MRLHGPNYDGSQTLDAGFSRDLPMNRFTLLRLTLAGLLIASFTNFAEASRHPQRGRVAAFYARAAAPARTYRAVSPVPLKHGFESHSRR